MGNVCCFFGHRKLEKGEVQIEKLNNILKRLIIDNEVTTFLFGSRSEFDDLCYEIISGLKEKYPYIKRIYVRAEYPYIDESYKKSLLKRYEETYFPEKLISAGKAVYVERNYLIIDNSNICVVYYNSDYIPKQRRENYFGTKSKSGTSLAFEYAVKKHKRIINLFE